MPKAGQNLRPIQGMAITARSKASPKARLFRRVVSETRIVAVLEAESSVARSLQ
jgi:hypothetical protein